MDKRGFLGGWAEGVVLEEGVDVVALEEHAFWRRHGGFDGGWGVGKGEAVEVLDVVLVGLRVGWVWKDEEVVGFLFEGFGVAAGDHWVGVISFWGGRGGSLGVPLK